MPQAEGEATLGRAERGDRALAALALERRPGGQQAGRERVAESVRGRGRGGPAQADHRPLSVRSARAPCEA
jgi:hypothetical protein